MVKSMKQGSVIVDLAAEGGGNCELTEKGKRVSAHGVTILGYTDLPSRLATQSSRLFGNNLHKLVKLLGEANEFVINKDDEIVRGALVLDRGKLSWPPPKVEVSIQPQKGVQSEEAVELKAEKEKKSIFSPGVMLGILAVSLLALGWKEKMNFWISLQSLSYLALSDIWWSGM